MLGQAMSEYISAARNKMVKTKKQDTFYDA